MEADKPSDVLSHDLIADPQKKSFQDALFSCMFMLGRDKSPDSWQYTTLKVRLPKSPDHLRLSQRMAVGGAGHFNARSICRIHTYV